MCHSIKVKNCVSLAEEFSKQEILEDSVCRVQCSFALRVLPTSARSGRASSVFGFSN